MTLLELGPRQTVLSRAVAGQPAISHAMDVGTASIAARWRHDSPTPHEIEQAIDAIEEAVTRVPAALRPLNAIVTSDDAIAPWTAAAGGPLTLQAVEALFQRLASAALGDPASGRGLPGGREPAAALVIVRELMHHLGGTVVDTAA